MLHSICQQTWKSQQWLQDWKRSVFIPIPKCNAEECWSYQTIALISHVSKVILKILQATLQQHVNWEFLDVQAGFRKGRGIRDQIANICWIIEKAREFQKTSASLTILKPLTVWITTNCGKILQEMAIQDHLTCSWDTCIKVKKKQLGSNMEQQTCSKLIKKYVKAVYCHPSYLTSR